MSGIDGPVKSGHNYRNEDCPRNVAACPVPYCSKHACTCVPGFPYPVAAGVGVLPKPVEES